MSKARIQFKTDKTANWSDSFIPLAGELCVFSDYGDTGKTNHLGNKVYKSNIKIGTGNTNLSELPFFGNDYILLSDIYKLFYGVANLVPFSTNTNGSLYNGIGYKEGYRLSSNGSEKEQAQSVATGFIPATPNDIIRMSGVSWTPTVSGGYCYICFYDKNYNLLATINQYTGGAANGVSYIVAGTILNTNKSTHSITADENGVYTFNLSYQDGASFAYIRISAEGAGANMIVTKNEVINNNTTNLLDTATLDSLILG